MELDIQAIHCSGWVDLRVKDIARFGLKTGEMQTSDKSRENDKD